MILNTFHKVELTFPFHLVSVPTFDFCEVFTLKGLGGKKEKGVTFC